MTKSGAIAKNIEPAGWHPYMDKELKHIILKAIILNKIKRGNVYSYSLIKEISKLNNLKVFSKDIKNDVYNVISALEKSGYIKITARVENGRLKKYFTLTKKGDTALTDIKKGFDNAVKSLKKAIR
ncbi:MAG: PadR family transcriptional regulator [Candidatus Marsarchaeota archaeon]|jgi:PadR family transcriptional regulator PadR|nr:PadR family transcriptional regulator [Candidatus Marsarchaeota archaeon]